MSEEQLKAFLEKVKADTRFQINVHKAAGIPEAALQIAKEAGFFNYRRRYSINAIGRSESDQLGAGKLRGTLPVDGELGCCTCNECCRPLKVVGPRQRL